MGDTKLNDLKFRTPTTSEAEAIKKAFSRIYSIVIFLGVVIEGSILLGLIASAMKEGLTNAATIVLAGCAIFGIVWMKIAIYIGEKRKETEFSPPYLIVSATCTYSSLNAYHSMNLGSPRQRLRRYSASFLTEFGQTTEIIAQRVSSVAEGQDTATYYFSIFHKYADNYLRGRKCYILKCKDDEFKIFFDDILPNAM
jgi:hypothetical protein